MEIRILVAFLILSFCGCACETVKPGEVGIKVNYYGTAKGVENLPIVTGRVWYNPFTEDVKTYPTFMQQAVWTRDVTEGSPTNEEITLNSIEGSTMSVDVGLTYSFVPEKVPSIYMEFRQEAKEITHGYMRQKVRDSINEIASTMKVTDIFGQHKQQMLNDIKAKLKKELEPKGFSIDGVSFISSFRVDPRVEQSINMTIEASQKSIESQNKVAQIRAEADQAIEKARGTSEAVLLEAKAKAEANRILAQSISAELIQYEALQKWNGVMPQVTGQNMPFIQVTPKN